MTKATLLGIRAAAAAMLLAAAATSAMAWERPHGDSANTNFADVRTFPAKTPVKVNGLGTFAAGAGPVIAPDGTVYLGNQEGEVIALHADGPPYWRRSIDPGQSIYASPVIGADGMVYVIGIERYTDTNVNPPKQRTNSTLHRFTASGGWLGGTPFPTHVSRGAAGAAPNIWSHQGTELIMVPTVYSHNLGGGHDTRLIAFSTSGGVVADALVISFVPTVTGGTHGPSWKKYTCLIPPWTSCLTLGAVEGVNHSIMPPPPSVGIFTYAGGGTPFILVSDHYKDLVGYTFSGEHSFSPNSFVETFRLHDDNNYMRSAPTILPDAHAIIGVEAVNRDDEGTEAPTGGGGAIFAGPNMNKLSPVKGTGAVYATPTRMADGRVALVSYTGRKIAVVQGNQVVSEINFPPGALSIVSAAASHSHLFVSTTEAFLSYDTNTLAEVGRIDWGGGGASPPAIGPKGNVYAVAGDILFVFPAPREIPAGVSGDLPQAVVTALPASQVYHPPLTPSGNRLFACEELDQDDCGQGDYQAISLAFCQKQGFTKADSIDVDSRKGKAETLDGHFCTKKKCKVFDTIDCKM